MDKLFFVRVRVSGEVFDLKILARDDIAAAVAAHRIYPTATIWNVEEAS